MELLKKLSESFGPTGCEHEVNNIIYNYIKNFCDEIYYDKLNNLTAVIKGENKQKNKILIAAHTDEVGFMITHIDDDGFLYFDAIGIDPRVLCGRAVTLGNDSSNGGGTRRINGIIASKPIHLKQPEEKNKPVKIENLYIDIGASDRENAEKFILPGDYGTFLTEFKALGNNNYLGKAIDDRIGCAVMCSVIKKIRENNIKPVNDLYFAFTTREETGFSGARTAAFEINPDYAIVLEATAIADLPEVAEAARVAEIGAGPAISLMDRLTVYDNNFINKAVNIANKFNIKSQIKKYISGGNDAGAIQKTREGVPTIAISVPCRYLHSAASVFSQNDYESMKELIYKLLTNGDITNA